MKKTTKYSPEVRDQVVRMVCEQQKEHGSQWSAIESIAGKIGCTAETLRMWVRRAEIDQGIWGGLTSTERENRELKRANEIVRKASAFFA
ncbi:MAG: transposase family protein [Nitrospirae bacterium]|nr:MAG: transposase family protein [Nitrospirota bacterium]